MRKVLAAIVGVAMFGAAMLASAGAAAQRRSATADYEAQETAIYEAVFRHLLTEPLHHGGQSGPFQFCVAPTAAAPPDRYNVGLSHGVGLRTGYPIMMRYDRLARRYLRRTGHMPNAPRELDKVVLSQHLRIENTVLSGCDNYIVARFVRPALYGSAAFLLANIDGYCTSNTYNFALRRRGEQWVVEGFRSGIPAGESWCPTLRRQQPADQDQVQLLLVQGNN